MRIEFNGFVIEGTAEELKFNGEFSLTVNGLTALMQHPVAVNEAKEGECAYRMHFRAWPIGTRMLGGKIPVIKLLRELLGIGLGEAKALTEGTDMVIVGPPWRDATLRTELNSLLAREGLSVENTYDIIKCPMPRSGSTFGKYL